MADSVCTRTPAQSPRTFPACNGTGNACNGCRDNFPLPVGPFDFFDQRVVDGYVARRTECDLCPASDKPCIGPGAQAAIRFKPKAAKLERYPEAPRRDLEAALASMDRVEAETSQDCAAWRLLSMATDWLADSIREAGRLVPTTANLEQIVLPLGDVLALVQGAAALQASNCTLLTSAATLIERAIETLSSLEEVAA